MNKCYIRISCSNSYLYIFYLFLADEWAVDGQKTFVFLITCLLISMIVILLLAGGFVANICIKSLSNCQPGV